MENAARKQPSVAIRDGDVRNILIVQTAFIGDVILAEPLIANTRLQFPESNVDVLVIPATANLLQAHPDIRQLIVYDKRGRDRGLRALIRLIRTLRAARYDLALVPHRSLRSAFLVFAAGIATRVGFETSAGRWLFNVRVPYRETHEVCRNLELLAPFGARPVYQMPRVHCAETDVENAEAAIGPTGRPRVAIAPGSVWATKRWPLERFVALAEKLASDLDSQIILIGGPGDANLAAPFEQTLGDRCTNLIGKLSLRESVAALRQCAVLVSNDSAPTHLGVAAGCRVVTVFGATVPRFGFYPYGSQHRVIETERELACRPCGIHGGHRCPTGTFECMLSIPVERVFNTVKALLEETGALQPEPAADEAAE
ncbi:MAG: lipopolysaccharide heptosyltransferase II [candidate division KSB1 bacterium]|nr:lipopolysaccharide heptosyltransferase II [candidate division KSB1 bacterium]MDQ7063839.1 lipopolysaccharide heptosyltransferase II [candidate division KSB1 bacterium]